MQPSTVGVCKCNQMFFTRIRQICEIWEMGKHNEAAAKSHQIFRNYLTLSCGQNSKFGTSLPRTRNTTQDKMQPGVNRDICESL